MNRHDEAEQRVRAWLSDEARGELPDWVLRETFTTTRATPQRPSLLGRFASIAHHIPTTIHRRSTMFTTITAVAAAALIAVNVFVPDPTQPQTGAELPTLTVEEEMFSGRAVYGPPCLDASGGEIDNCYQMSEPNFDDPRLQGSMRMTANAAYMDQGIYRNQFTITTDEGAWVGDSVPGILTWIDTGAPSVHLLKGEGAYDGLYAVATVALDGGAFRWEGYIVHGGFPELEGD